MLICSACGQENPEGFRLCGMCGAALVAEVVESVAVLSGELWPTIEIYAGIGAKPREAEARLLAAMEAGEGDPAGRNQARRALDLYRSMGADPAVRHALELLGATAADAGAGSP